MVMLSENRLSSKAGMVLGSDGDVDGDGIGCGDQGGGTDGVKAKLAWARSIVVRSLWPRAALCCECTRVIERITRILSHWDQG